MDDIYYNRKYGNSEFNSSSIIDEVSALRSELSVLRAQNNSLSTENKKLEKILKNFENMPAIVGIVNEIIGEKAIIRGYNGVVFAVNIPKKFEKSLNNGDRVAMAQSNLAILDVFPEDKDYRALAFEISKKPETSFNQIGGLEDVILEAEETVSLPLKEPQKFKEFGIRSPKGILLYGEPGTGKTLLARAIANSADATFISLSGAELIHKFIGEGAKVVKDLFKMAREKSPSIVFIDEIDAIAAYRTDNTSGADREVHRTMMQLLVEMDGFSENDNIKILGATNRIDILDEAILRPGRFDRVIEVPIPKAETREKIFNIHLKTIPLGKSIDIKELVKLSRGATGAQIESICREAAIFAIRNNSKLVEHKYFKEAIEKVLDTQTNKKDEKLGNMFQ